MRTNLWMRDSAHQFFIDKIGFKAGKPNPSGSQPLHCLFNQIGKIRRAVPILGKIHSRQYNFRRPGCLRRCDSPQRLFKRKGNRLSPCQPDPAVTTGIVTSVLNFDKRPYMIQSRRAFKRKRVAFSEGGEEKPSQRKGKRLPRRTVGLQSVCRNDGKSASSGFRAIDTTTASGSIF